MTFIKNFLRDEAGASAAEYALILAIVGAAIAAAMVALGNAVDDRIDNATTAVGGTPDANNVS